MSDYVEQIGRIERVFLGVEDHGIFTCSLTMDFGSSGQTIGNYSLDASVEGKDGRSTRVGTAYGLEWLMRLMRAVGVSDWEHLKGKTIYVLRDGDGYGARVVGVRALPFEKTGATFIFDDLAEEMGL